MVMTRNPVSPRTNVAMASPPAAPAPPAAAAPAVPPPSVPAPPAFDPGSAGSHRPRRRGWLGRLVLVLIPLASFGVLSWVAIAYVAGRRRSRTLACAAAGYFVLTGLFFVAVAINPDAERMRPTDVVGILALLLAMFGGAVHAALLDPSPQVDARA
jgi:hypothetical protein